jgi:hypothetical protein
VKRKKAQAAQTAVFNNDENVSHTPGTGISAITQLKRKTCQGGSGALI